MDNRKTVLRKYFVACEFRVNLNYSTEVHFKHFSIGSKATRDKVNQTAHVQKASWKPGRQEKLAANLAMCSRSGRNSSYFQR